MSIQTKMTEGIICGQCHKPINGVSPIDSLPGSGFKNAFPAALAQKCQNCEIFLCKKCYTNEKESLKGLRKLRGLNCPCCGSKFDNSGICVYPMNLDMDAVVAGPSIEKRTQTMVHTETATGISCNECGLPIEGQLTQEPLTTKEGSLTFPATVGLKCQYCLTFLCKDCYLSLKQDISGWKTFAGISFECPYCGLQFSSLAAANQGIYPPGVNLNKLDEFDQVMEDLFNYRAGIQIQKLENELIHIKEHSELLLAHIKDHIRSRGFTAGLLLKLKVLGRAGAEWFLDENVLSDENVEKIVEIAQSKGKTTMPTPGLVVNTKDMATRVLIEIEIARKDSRLIPNIIEAEKAAGVYSLDIGRITWDERIVDCLIEELDDKWEIRDPRETNLWRTSFIPSGAQFAAMALIATGSERGTRAATQRVFKHIINIRGTPGHSLRYNKVIDWWKEHGEKITPYLIEGLEDEDPDIRLFVVRALETICDANLVAVLSDLENDPDGRVRHRSQVAVKRMKKLLQSGLQADKLLDQQE